MSILKKMMGKDYDLFFHPDCECEECMIHLRAMNAEEEAIASDETERDYRANRAWDEYKDEKYYKEIGV
jgi:hypothetical protein